MKKILFFAFTVLIVFLSLSDNSYASEWMQIETSIDGENDYIDLDSIESNSPVVTFWTKNVDKKGETIKTRFSINCKKGIGAIREIIIYSPEETVLRSYLPKDEKLQWGKIDSDSFIDGFKRLICKERTKELTEDTK